MTSLFHLFISGKKIHHFDISLSLNLSNKISLVLNWFIDWRISNNPKQSIRSSYMGLEEVKNSTTILYNEYNGANSRSIEVTVGVNCLPSIPPCQQQTYTWITITWRLVDCQLHNLIQKVMDVKRINKQNKLKNLLILWIQSISRGNPNPASTKGRKVESMIYWSNIISS